MFKNCLPAVLLLTGCAAPRHSAFDETCEMLERTPVGTEIREIERLLSLPPPAKTFVGSSLYPNRIFRYIGNDGLFIEIGLYQRGEVQDYPQGRFEYIGHHSIASASRIWKRWVWDDIGPIEVRGSRDSSNRD
jgi:hypothetical protein